MSKDYIKSLELQNLKLLQKLKIDKLLTEIEICQSVIELARDPDLINLFKKRRDEALKKINELKNSY